MFYIIYFIIELYYIDIHFSQIISLLQWLRRCEGVKKMFLFINELYDISLISTFKSLNSIIVNTVHIQHLYIKAYTKYTPQI